MKSYCAYGKYLLSFSFFTGLIVLNHVLINTDMVMGNINMTEVCDSTASSMIDPQQFVFFNADKLVRFEHKKKERARCLLEQLCGVKRMNVQRNVFFARAAACAITWNNCVYSHCGKQQFGIPHVVYVDKNLLVKQIAAKQKVEKNTSRGKVSMLCALEKLLE